MAKGLIIYFDGPDGVGKTTQLELARQSLQKSEKLVTTAHTLGGTPIGDKLREIFFSDLERPADTNLHIAMAIQLAFVPELLRLRDEGNIILIDRSPLSILAYQVYGDGLPREKGIAAVAELFEIIQPDLLLVYAATQVDLLARREVQRLSKPADHFEKMSDDYHARVARGYSEVGGNFGGKQVDSSGSVDEVHADTMASINSLLKA